MLLQVKQPESDRESQPQQQLQRQTRPEEIRKLIAAGAHDEQIRLVPDVLRLEEVPTPTPAANEVLVEVHAAAVNRADWEILRGSPLWVRLVGFGLTGPRAPRLGSNLAGRIVAIGGRVSQFGVCDDICGDILNHGLGAFAEYVCVPEVVITM